MHNKKAIWWAFVIVVIIVLILVFAFYEGPAKVMSDGTDVTQEDGIGYTTDETRQLNDNEI